MTPTIMLAKTNASWITDAACRDMPPGLFYAPHAEATSERVTRELAAKRVCAACPVRAACLDHALHADEELGVWGGMTESERRALQPARQEA
jgi:WhiB family redox-sensing transcriptional regulator